MTQWTLSSVACWPGLLKGPSWPVFQLSQVSILKSFSEAIKVFQQNKLMQKVTKDKTARRVSFRKRVLIFFINWRKEKIIIVRFLGKIIKRYITKQIQLRNCLPNKFCPISFFSKSKYLTRPWKSALTGSFHKKIRNFKMKNEISERMKMLNFNFPDPKN